MLSILKIIGVILLVILAVLLLIILLPRHFWIEYSKRDGPIVKMNLLFFKVRLYPLPNFITGRKKKDKKPEKSEKKKENGEKKKSITDDIEFSFDLVKQILSAARGIIKRVLRAIRFRDVSFTVPLSGRDAYKTQQMYTKVTSAFYSLNTVIQQIFRITYKSPLFIADFGGQYSDALYFYSQVTASPVALISAGIFAFGQYRQIMKNNKKGTDKE